jgi:hypothetical protein
MANSPWHKEIIDLHDFFHAWLGGTLPAEEAVFARLADATDPAFTLITPDGEAVARDKLIEQLRAAHGSRPNWRMWIANVELRAHAGELVVATYEEWHQTGDATTVRLCTAVFREQPAAPNGVVWVHVHETWRANR